MMKNYKGSKKDFARYLQSEIDDDYLEPLETPEFDLKKANNNDEAKKCSCGTCKHCINKKDSKQYKKSQNFYDIRYSNSLDPYLYSNTAVKNPVALKTNIGSHTPTKPLTDQIMKECVLNLGQDAKNCYYGLLEFKTLHIHKDNHIFEKFKDLYSAFKTLQVIYLSITHKAETSNNRKVEAVYVWQMNQRCPCTKEEKEQDVSLMTDVKSHLTSKKYLPSILVLAKIVPEIDEEILGAKLLENDKLLIQSTSRLENEVIYKIYNITDFEVSARVNPFHHNVLANSLYSWKLKIHSYEDKSHLSLWKKYTLEEELDQHNESSDDYELITIEKEKKLQEITSDTLLSTNNLSVLIEKSSQGWTVFIDKQTLSFIVWKDNTIHITNTANIIGSLQTFEVFKGDTCVLINKKGEIFTLDQSQLPEIIIKQTPHVLPNVTNLQFQIMDFWGIEGELDLWDQEDDEQKIINLIYYWKDNFHCLDLNGTRKNILFGLKDEPEKGFSWRFLERRKESQRVIFYTKKRNFAYL